ncbi:CoA transferase [Mycolicibacterium mengxianglii]|uniref:CoA transferase n=1 Tax=Mycolicibacterium mengxianglii TaxID=2736649 RepID=UPI0018EEEDA4|nr:CoA transferase [Mycolicibacterium mengxianglii]
MSGLRIPEAVLTRAAQIAPDAAELITGRAALLGIAPQGRISAGGATRLFPADDGWCALTLSRSDDIAAVPALVESSAGEPWQAVQAWAARRTVEQVVGRAQLLGLPVAALGEADPAPPRVFGCGTAGPARAVAGLLVVDLTSMWAGPLCGRQLADAGATVVKVESPGRPDGTRAGQRAFFDWMNTGKLCYSVDFDDEALRRLLEVADVVLEGSRPAALSRRGLGPHDIPPRPGRVWLRITGHGTDGAHAERVAFGDDAAVAGGLVGWCEGEPGFVGDAIADPLSGLAATAAVLEAVGRGGGVLIEVSMAAVAATYAALPPTPAARIAATVPHPVAAAAASGADNAEVVRLVAERSCWSC